MMQGVGKNGLNRKVWCEMARYIDADILDLQGYKSPIEIIYKDIQLRMDNGILKAVQECNIHVDRDELIRALQYDRGQYEKGYADGVAAAKMEGNEHAITELHNKG